MISIGAAMRTIVDLPEDQIEGLRRLGQREGLSRAELLRRAVAAYLERQGSPGEMEEAFGLWRQSPVDADGQVERLRDEWVR